MHLSSEQKYPQVWGEKKGGQETFALGGGRKKRRGQQEKGRDKEQYMMASVAGRQLSAHS